MSSNTVPYAPEALLRCVIHVGTNQSRLVWQEVVLFCLHVINDKWKRHDSPPEVIHCTWIIMHPINTWKFFLKDLLSSWCMNVIRRFKDIYVKVSLCDIDKDIKITFTNKCTFYLTRKMLKFSIKTSIHSPLHVSVHLDHLQGAYGDPC
jgi:hypothetical protein